MSTRNAPRFATPAAALVGLLIPTLGLSAPPNTPITVEFLSAEGVLLPDSFPIDPEAFTYFVVHGFRDQGAGAASLRQADAIRQRAPGANVIVVDWHVPRAPRPPYSQIPIPCLRGINTITVELMGVDADYHRSVAAASEIGRQIAEWMKENGVLPSRTVISGHSLGAQIAAFVGKACARPELFDQPIAAILAADPAGPRFEGQPSEGRLSRDDAEQVIVVHATELLGDENRIGTLDVYIDWPETDIPDYAGQHSLARELVTESFLRPEMSHTDRTPFGANALGFDFGDDESRVYRPGTESSAAPASTVPTE